MREVLQHPNVRRCLPYLALFLVAYVTHFMSGVIASGDSRWSVSGAYSLVYDGDLTLDEFPEMLEEHEYYWVDRIGSHWYTRFPIGMSLLSAPLVFALDVSSVVLFWVWPGLEERIIDASVKPLEEVTVLTMYWRIELVIACFFMSVAALLMFRIGRKFLSSPKALILVFWFLYCTPVWSTGSRSLGQHCGSILMLTLALIFVLAARKNARWIQFAALPLSFSFVIRPTNALPIIAFTIYVLIAHRDYFVKYLGWAAVIAIPFSVYNWNVYDSLLAPYYLPQDQLGEASPYETNYLNGMTGLLFSPARGLFVYSPLFVFSFAGATLGYRKTRDRLYVILPVLCIFHWLLLSSFGDWWGGHSYGPRYFSDLSPIFVYLLIPILQLEFQPWTRPRVALVSALVVVSIVSFAMHSQGATQLACWEWNRSPKDVNVAQERLWDWEDAQFLRGFR